MSRAGVLKQVQMLLSKDSSLEGVFLMVRNYMQQQKFLVFVISFIFFVIGVTLFLQIPNNKSIYKFIQNQSTTPKDKTVLPLDNEQKRVNILPASETLEKNSIQLIVDGTTTRLSFLPGDSFFDVLLEAQKNERITFSGKTFSGLGFFVTNIGKLESGGGKTPKYYINGKEASVGVSFYVPQNGDVIEWKLE